MKVKESTQGIFLTQQEANYLDQIIGKLPTSYGIIFVDFFRMVQQRIEAENKSSEPIDNQIPVENESELLP